MAAAGQDERDVGAHAGREREAERLHRRHALLAVAVQVDAVLAHVAREREAVLPRELQREGRARAVGHRPGSMRFKTWIWPAWYRSCDAMPRTIAAWVQRLVPTRRGKSWSRSFATSSRSSRCSRTRWATSCSHDSPSAG